MTEKQPKVFISYAWTSEEHKDKVREFSERLMHNGVDVILNQWDLLPGQDQYHFMEKSVNDSTVTKVLIICNKEYKKKANNREGGVGTETMIISPEIYGNVGEDKFIPIIFEREENEKGEKNENGIIPLPTYIKSRIYVDLSLEEDYEKNYVTLIRYLHDRPEHSKPPLGKMPEYFNEESVDLGNLRILIKQIKAFDGKIQQKYVHYKKNFTGNFIELLLKLVPIIDQDLDSNFLQQLDLLLPLRNVFFDYVETIITEGYEVDEILGDFFEQVYNQAYFCEKQSWDENDFEFEFFAIWEMFIGMTAIMLYYEEYEQLNKLLNRTYFLNGTPVMPQQQASKFVRFRRPFNYIEYLKLGIANKEGLPNFAGGILIQRLKKPILTKESIVNADIVLYQLSDFFNFKSRGGFPWFPNTYGYWGNTLNSPQQVWARMKSRRHCEKIFPLLGVDTITKLKQTLSNHTPYRLEYPGDSWHAPVILDSINLEDIATLP
ncbi:MAG: TIR domain-containing protein [Firmicutes bacterium]|nr:TIR domain-containing protein [Bacillota bacterium]